ncbi:MAG: hypothetical protein ACXAB7_22840, partial [Candidatus Kariarchaeaceae archaeon]
FSVFMFLFAMGSSQESGALEAWFDNSYQDLAHDDDPERDIYTRYQARASVLFQAMALLGFLAGGLLASLISRKFVFFIFLILLILIFFIIQFRLPRDKPNPDALSVKSYLTRVKQSFMIFLHDRIIFFYFVGIAIMWAVNESIWYTFVMFRLYHEYTGSDAGTGIIRALVYFTGLLWQLLVIRVIKYFSNAHFWVFFATLVSNALFFALVFIYYLHVPPGDLDLLVIIGFLSIYQIPAAWEALQSVLMQRINLDLIPDDYRNSLYSLLPTLARAIGIAFALIAGFIIDIYGFDRVFYLLIATSLVGSSILGLGLLKAPKS